MTEIKTYTLEELQTLDNNYTGGDLVVENTNLLQEQGIEILLDESSLQEDKRYLIPIKYKDKFGFIKVERTSTCKNIEEKYINPK